MDKAEILDLGFSIKMVDEDKGIIEGYGSIFDIKDFQFDVVEKGAFVKSLKKRKPSMLLQHNSHDVIGVWTKAEEDGTGLKLTGQLNMEVQKAKEAFHLIKQGALSGLSIGFITKESEWIDGVRHLMELDLKEVSLVTFPANDMARVNGAKSEAPQTERDLEAALRNLGYGRNEAKAIVSGGFKVYQTMQRDADGSEKDVQREADEEKARQELINSLNELTKTFKG